MTPGIEQRLILLIHVYIYLLKQKLVCNINCEHLMNTLLARPEDLNSIHAIHVPMFLRADSVGRRALPCFCIVAVSAGQVGRTYIHELLCEYWNVVSTVKTSY